MKRIVIKKNFYFSAGAKHGWRKDYDRRGVGIRLEVLKENAYLEISIGGGEYTLNCAEAIAFIKHYRSIETYKGVRVGIISKSLLRAIEALREVPKEEIVKQEILQSKLF